MDGWELSLIPHDDPQFRVDLKMPKEYRQQYQCTCLHVPKTPLQNSILVLLKLPGPKWNALLNPTTRAPKVLNIKPYVLSVQLARSSKLNYARFEAPFNESTIAVIPTWLVFLSPTNSRPLKTGIRLLFMIKLISKWIVRNKYTYVFAHP
jgi:hypothetical protein